MDPYKIFNSKTKECLKDLKRSYPDIKEVKMIYLFFKITKKMSTKAPCKFFDMVTSPYKNDILNRDDSFVYQESFNIIYIKNVKELIKKISNENKDILWDYLHVLIKLSEKCDLKNVSIDEMNSFSDEQSENLQDIESDDD